MRFTDYGLLGCCVMQYFDFKTEDESRMFARNVGIQVKSLTNFTPRQVPTFSFALSSQTLVIYAILSERDGVPQPYKPIDRI
jgi:hypothetical protein